MVEVAAATAAVTAIAGKSYEVNDQVAEVKAGAVVRSASGAHLEEPVYESSAAAVATA